MSGDEVDKSPPERRGMTVIEELKKLAEAATPGEWISDEVRTSSGRAFRIGTGEMIKAGKGCCIIYDDFPGNPKNERSANAAFIAASRSAIPALIERVERAEAENARMREALEFYAEPANFLNSPPWEEDPECFTPNAVPFTTQEDGAKVCDCGDKARAALGRRS